MRYTMQNNSYYQNMVKRDSKENKKQDQKLKNQILKKYKRQNCYAEPYEKTNRASYGYQDINKKFINQKRNQDIRQKNMLKSAMINLGTQRQYKSEKLSDQNQFLKNYSSTYMLKKNKDVLGNTDRQYDKYEQKDNYKKYERKSKYDNGDENRIDEMTRKLDLALKNTKNKQRKVNQYQRPQFIQNKRKQIKKQHKQRQRKVVKQLNKYDEMKASLGFTRYLPPQIILQQQQSLSQNSRLNVFTKQFTNIFQKLDVYHLGFLNKNNYGIQNLSEEFKYLIWGITSKIKYKNQQFSLNLFIKECKILFKDLKIDEVQKIFMRVHVNQNEEYQKIQNEKYQKIQNEKYQMIQNEKYQKIQNEKYQKIQNLPNYKYVNETYGQDTKRSSDLSVVIKKYQLQGQRQNDLVDIQQMKRIHKQDEDFDKMCQNLNNKLNQYIQSVANVKPSIKLQFSQLSKHLKN